MIQPAQKQESSKMQNPQAMKLPDPLLVRYYRDAKIDAISKVVITKNTRAITVTLRGGVVERWSYLKDIGWIPDAG